ncbi:PQQ-binding-like beta-propeller repeat protein [Acidianus brierleyi]|uniref:outer membrane protein assembly factor BamB family protein n=1 Tax=Acidianus brierleyi TaxID=41673 RepID=UPI0013A59D52|nr:PQQ-binding-like beta-propeller repeat protein [Acidianus brierleyi]
MTVGDVGFTFSAIANLLANEPQKVFRGMGYGAIYAFNAQNGQLIWMMYTKGELMPSPAVYGNELVFATGNGTIEAVNPYDGEELWQDNLQGYIDSMSSLDYYILPNGIPVFIAGFTLLQQPYGVVVAVNGENGDILWISTPTDWSIYDTSGGDGPVAVDQQSGIVVQENVANESNNYVYTIVTAYNASNGEELWTTPIGYGYLPVAFKSAVPYIDNGIVYITSPSTASVTALNITNGNVIWNTSLTPYVKPASPDTPGAPRGAPVIYNGYLWLTAGPYVLALNPSNGQIEDSYDIGGGFGITNPVIAGSTMFLANSFGWAIAIPLQDIVPSLQ